MSEKTGFDELRVKYKVNFITLYILHGEVFIVTEI